MGEVRLRGTSRSRAPRQYRPVPRYTLMSDGRREPISVRTFIRALTRFQPRHDTWQSEIPAIQSRVSEEFRRLHRRDNADFILSPRSPYSEFRPRSAHPDCKKEFVPKTNICFGNPEQKIPRRYIRSAPPSIQRSVTTMSPRSPGRFEHNILQDEYFELRSMLRQSVQQKDTLEEIVSRPKGIYSHRYPSTNHRIFCVEDKVGMGYFKRFRNELVDNLTLDLDKLGKPRDEHDLVECDKAGEKRTDDTVAILNYVPEKEAVEKDAPKDSARSFSSVGTSVSSFNSKGEVQTGTRSKECFKVTSIPTHQTAEAATSTSKDVCTSTEDDKCEAK